MRPTGWIAALVILLASAAFVGLGAGAAGWRGEPLAALLAGDEIVRGLRAPRVVAAGITGGALALAGLAMQTLLRNDLADPYVLGLAGGASVGAVASLALAPGLPPGPAAAAGAAGASALVRILGRGTADSARLVLAGVAVGAVLTSATGLVLVLAPPERLLRAATFWLFGGLGTPGWETLAPAGVVLVAATVWMRRRAERLDRLLLGADVAASLGVDVRGLRRRLAWAGVLLTAGAVALAGLVGFVGLLAPHAARRLVGAAHRPLAPVAGLLGALLVVVADTAARTAFAPRELPVGLLTAAIGGPLFLWLVGRRPAWS